jgi:hypothetical protein
MKTNKLHLSLINRPIIGYANLWAVVCEDVIRGSE